MIIRDAALADIGNIIDAIESFVAASSYKGEQVNRGYVEATIEQLILSPDGLVIVLDAEDGSFAGVFIGLAHGHLFSGRKVLGELFIYTTPSARGNGGRLRVAAEKWARENECHMFGIAHPLSESYLEKVYRRWGFEPQEVHYKKELN